MPTISPTDKLGALAVRIAAASSVFHKYRIDFCCAGGRTLAEACEELGLSAEVIALEIERAGAASGDEASLAERSLTELVDYILNAYHAPLRPELERLEGMAYKVLRVHGDKDPATLTRLAEVVHELAQDLRGHMAKEEDVLFPWIASGRGASAGGPVDVMLHDHEQTGAQLAEIEALTAGFKPPAGACATWRALYLGLRELDMNLKDHMHIENNLLFPRALKG